MVAEAAAVTSASWVAPAPANPSRMPAVGAVPAFAIAHQDRSAFWSVATARPEASQLRTRTFSLLQPHTGAGTETVAHQFRRVRCSTIRRDPAGGRVL